MLASFGGNKVDTRPRSEMKVFVSLLLPLAINIEYRQLLVELCCGLVARGRVDDGRSHSTEGGCGSSQCVPHKYT